MVVPRLSRVLPQLPGFNDAWLRAECDQCREPRSLAACKTEADDRERVYRCPVCNDLLVLITGMTGLTHKWPTRGYRFGDLMMWSDVAVILRVNGTDVRLDAMGSYLRNPRS